MEKSRQASKSSSQIAIAIVLYPLAERPKPVTGGSTDRGWRMQRAVSDVKNPSCGLDASGRRLWPERSVRISAHLVRLERGKHQATSVRGRPRELRLRATCTYADKRPEWQVHNNSVALPCTRDGYEKDSCIVYCRRVCPLPQIARGADSIQASLPEERQLFLG
jgi:hypothetical protein